MRGGRSSAVKTACTPATARAAAVSMARIFACACGLRTKQADSTPGTLMSSTKRPAPTSSVGSSRRATRAPNCRAPIQPSACWRAARAAVTTTRSLEYFVEAALDAAGFLLDHVVVDREDLQRFEIGRAFR